MTPEDTLERAGFTLPEVTKPVANYVMAAWTGSLLFVSGHGAFDRGSPVHTGRLGADLTTEDGRLAAQAVMLNLLATVRAQLGSLSAVERVVKVVVFVNSTPAFTQQHLVADGATDLLICAFGDTIGRPARSAVGVAALPLGFAVEIEAVFQTA